MDGIEITITGSSPLEALASMDADTEINILSRAVETYGAQAQMDMMLEEMSELGKALLKYRRADREQGKYGGQIERRKADVREEMADVQIMLDQMGIIFGDSGEERSKALDRLERRLGRRQKMNGCGACEQFFGGKNAGVGVCGKSGATVSRMGTCKEAEA